MTFGVPMTVAQIPEHLRTIDDLLQDLGNVPASRVRLRPSPGHATVQDVLDVHARERRLCELVDGTLVEKPMGYKESMIAIALAAALRDFVRARNLGIVTGEAGMMRLFPDLVRIPDVAFVSRDRLPGGKVPSEQVPLLAPDLAVEVLSPSNTQREMERKRGEYFRSGVRLVWIVDIDERAVNVYTAPEHPVKLSGSAVLDGGVVLPGFSLSLTDLFADLDEYTNP
jgi:Uma2 family endonuclease